MDVNKELFHNTSARQERRERTVMVQGMRRASPARLHARCGRGSLSRCSEDVRALVGNVYVNGVCQLERGTQQLRTNGVAARTQRSRMLELGCIQQHDRDEG